MCVFGLFCHDDRVVEKMKCVRTEAPCHTGLVFAKPRIGTYHLTKILSVTLCYLKGKYKSYLVAFNSVDFEQERWMIQGN